MEHGHANHLADDWAATAYWYQTLPARPFGILPVAQRLPSHPQGASAPAVGNPPTLNAEMQAALATAEQRGADYLREREREVVKKIARTRQRSLGNIEQAHQIRKACDRS